MTIIIAAGINKHSHLQLGQNQKQPFKGALQPLKNDTVVFNLKENKQKSEPSFKNRLLAFKGKFQQANTPDTRNNNTSNGHIDHKDIHKLTATFSQKLAALLSTDNLTIDELKSSIKEIVPGVSVEVVDINTVPELAGAPVKALCMPEPDETGEKLKFVLLYNLKDFNKDRQLNTLSTIHEFVHLLQTNTKEDYELTLNAATMPYPALTSLPVLFNTFHSVEMRISQADVPEEKYLEMVKGALYNFPTSEEKYALKFMMVKAFDEAQAHLESLKMVGQFEELNVSDSQSPAGIVHYTVSKYIPLVNSCIKMLQEDQAYKLTAKEKDLIQLYAQKLDTLKNDFRELDL